jgi:hypothetical protein
MTTRTTKRVIAQVAADLRSSTLCYVSAEDYKRYWKDGKPTGTFTGFQPARPRPVQLELPFDPEQLELACTTQT